MSFSVWVLCVSLVLTYIPKTLGLSGVNVCNLVWVIMCESAVISEFGELAFPEPSKTSFLLVASSCRSQTGETLWRILVGTGGLWLSVLATCLPYGFLSPRCAETLTEKKKNKKKNSPNTIQRMSVWNRQRQENTPAESGWVPTCCKPAGWNIRRHLQPETRW